MPRSPLLIALVLALFSLSACETREVARSTYSAPTELQPIPTRIEDQTPPNHLRRADAGSKFDPLGDIGRAFANLMPKKKPKTVNQATIQTQSADGTVSSLPPGYTGSTDYHAADGKQYKLDFKEGTLTGIDSSNKAAGDQPSK